MKRSFRAKRASGAVRKAIHDRLPVLTRRAWKYLQEEKAETNKRGKEIIDHIEVTLQKLIIEELKRNMDPKTQNVGSSHTQNC